MASRASTLAKLTDKQLDNRIEKVLDRAECRMNRTDITRRVAIYYHKRNQPLWMFTLADVHRVGCRLRVLQKRGLVQYFIGGAAPPFVLRGWFTQVRFAPSAMSVNNILLKESARG